MASLGNVRAKLFIEIAGATEQVFLGDVAIPLRASKASSANPHKSRVTYELACDLSEVKHFVENVFRREEEND